MITIRTATWIPTWQHRSVYRQCNNLLWSSSNRVILFGHISIARLVSAIETMDWYCSEITVLDLWRQTSAGSIQLFIIECLRSNWLSSSLSCICARFSTGCRKILALIGRFDQSSWTLDWYPVICKTYSGALALIIMSWWQRVLSAPSCTSSISCHRWFKVCPQYLS